MPTEVTIPEYMVEALDKHLKSECLTKEMIEEATAKGIEKGMMALASNDDFTTKFWRTGYEKMTEHASDGLSKSLGKRIFAAIGTMLLSYAIYLLAKSGTKI